VKDTYEINDMRSQGDFKGMSFELSRKVDVKGIIASNVYAFAHGPSELCPRWDYMEDLRKRFFGNDSKNDGAERNWQSFKSSLIRSRINYTLGTGKARFDMVVYSEIE